MTLTVVTNQGSENAKAQAIKGTAGKVVALWGCVGAGKTNVALNVAFELASIGKKVLLVDADTHRPSVAALLGLVDSGPGLTAVLRLARSGRLDLAELERLSEQVNFGKQSIRVIPGINSVSRWPEVDPAALEELLRFAKDNFDFTIVDVAAELEPGLFTQTSDIPRNYASSGVISLADLVIGLFSADPVGVNRLLSDLREVNFEFMPIANRVRSSVLGRAPERQLRDTMFRVARLKLHSTIPDDASAVDLSQQRGQPLLLAAKSSKAREAIRMLSLELADL